MQHDPNATQLTENHWHEWVIGSGVDPTLTLLNVRSPIGTTPYEYLLYALPQTERRNDGRLRDKYLSQYAHIEQGGWWVSGLDPLSNWEQMGWGRFKPDNPRIDWEKGKPVKYESPPKTPNRVTYFNISDCIWDSVARRYNIKRYHSPLALRLQDRLKPLCFWEWVQAHPEIPIIFVEGEKKAACLLSLGFVAIALPGIWNGRIGKKDFDERLHPDLVSVAQPGRKFIILFDYETKPKTRWSVYQAIVRTGKAIEDIGCQCEVAVLPGPEKGVDDFVVERGDDANALLTAIIDDAKSLKDYRRSYHVQSRGLSHKYPPNVRVNVQYLSNAVKLPQSGLVVLWSDMGTGKTELLKRWRDEHPEQRFLNNGHRVNLLKNLALRLQTEMYSDLGYVGLAASTALSITIDSLHKLNTQALTYGCVFIDEACQYLTHLLHSKTCKEHRAAILEVLEYIVYNTPLVVLADAHMDDVTVDFFRAMRPTLEEPFIIKNEWKNGERTIYWYEGDNSSAQVAQISAALMAGQKIMVVSDSKRFIKKLEQSLTVQVWSDDNDADSISQRLRVWSVHSDNSGSEENVAFIKDITNAVKSLDALLASPSLGTGLDIAEYHFDAVFGAFHAISQTATECAQQLYRYRPKVPIHVWVAPFPPYGYLDTNATKIKERLLQTNEMTAFLLRIDRNSGQRGAEKDWALDAYVHIQAARHQSINNLRADLRDLLSEMGNQIIPMGALSDKLAQEHLKNAAAALDTAYYSAVSGANNITASEYRLRQSKDYLKPEEVFECEKFRIQDAYGMEATESLVEKDDSGRLIRALANLEAILSEPDGVIKDSHTGLQYPTPPTIVADKDRQERFHLTLCMDWGNYSARWLARFNLGLHDILKRLVTGEEVTSTDPDLLRMTETAKQCACHVKAILGFTVPPDCQPMWLLALLVEQLGLKLTNRKQGVRGQQVKYYKLSPSELKFASAVIAHRASKRAKIEDRVRLAAVAQTRFLTGLPIQYGVAPPNIPVSTPPDNGYCISLGEGVNTADKQVEMLSDSWRSKLKDYVQLIIQGVESGIDAVKKMLGTLTTDQRWGVMLEFEQVNPEKFAQMISVAPDWVKWCNG